MNCSPHVSFGIPNPKEDGVQTGAADDLRMKQVRELEQLQKVIDENNELRATYNALQTQVVQNYTDTYKEPEEPSIQYQNETQITPEEVETLKEKLEKTLFEYKLLTQNVGKLNQQLERKYQTLNEIKMRTRIQQDERLSRQNHISANGIASFKEKTERVKEGWVIERKRLTKSIAYLKHVYTTSVADYKEYEEQLKANNKGLLHLSASITAAKDDIKEYQKQIESTESRLQIFEELQEKHRQSEVLVVELSDQIEDLKKKVDTDSLTAKVKKRLERGNQKIADLNRAIDQIQDKATAIKDTVKETKSRINDLNLKCEKIKKETNEILGIVKQLELERQQIKNELTKCFEINEVAGSNNILLTKEITDGVGLEPKSPMNVRRQMLLLKGEIVNLDTFQQKQVEMANNLKATFSSELKLPPRKRVPLIPLMK